MANNPDYKCTRCGKPTERSLLTVKKVVFLEMGLGGRTIRSRVVDWLCPHDIALDDDWNREKFLSPAQTVMPSMETVSG